MAATALLFGAVGLAVVLRRHNAEPPKPPPTEAAVVPETLKILSFDVQHFATVDGHSAPPRLLGKEAFQTHYDDSVTLKAQLSHPAYAFLIAFRADGTTDVCFPETEDEPPPLTDQPRYPSKSLGNNYGLEEGVGLQVFALAVSSRPLPSFKEWWPQCRGCPWQKYDAPSQIVWRADGVADVEALTEDRTSGTRGKKKEITGKTPVAQLAAWLRQTPGIETVQVLGFAVMPKEKR